MIPPAPHVPDVDGNPDRDQRLRRLCNVLERHGPDAIAAAIVVLDVEDLLALAGVLLVVAENVEASARPERASLAREYRRLAAHVARRAVDRFCSTSGVYAGARAGLRRDEDDRR